MSTVSEHFRHRTINLLSKAYTSLPLLSACRYLGLPADLVIKGKSSFIRVHLHRQTTTLAADKYGWSYDSSTQILYPRQESARTPRHSSSSEPEPNTIYLLATDNGVQPFRH